MDNHIIAAGDKATAEAAAEILWLGGNAFDAAVGAVFASMTSEPVLTGPGGAGHFMACRSGEKPVLFDFFADMPGTNPDETDLDFFDIEVDFGAEQQQFHIGKGSVAIPGTVAGLFHVQEQLGYLGIKDVMAPAIRIAKEGTTLSDVQAYLIDILSPILVQDREGADLYAPGGKLIQGGDRFAIPPLSDLLDGLSQEGPDLMYRGEVADRIVELLNRAAASGKDITLADAALAHTLTNNARQEKLADGVVVASRKKLSLDSDFPQFVDSLIRRDIGGTGADPLSHGSTTQVSILDREGNAASVTTTNGEGCGYMVPGLGFMLNNMLGEEDLNPKGFHRHRPRSRLPSMVAPTIVTKNGTPVLLTGSAGSNRIRSAIVQMIVEVIEGGVEIEAATIAPRLHIDGDTLQAEPGADEAVLEQLSSFYKIHRWDEKNLYFGGANSVTPAGGAGDPRRGGHAMVV